MVKQIQLANVENLFWHNGSREVPSKLVAATNFGTNRRDIKIHWNSRTSGTATIDGIWNYARYSGSYYFLDIIHPKDDNQDKFLYAIYRDEWAEFLWTKKRITGTLIKTNAEGVLWKHLQTTSPVTNNLGASKIIKLISDQNLTSGVEKIIHIPDEFKLKTWVITRQRFEEYVTELKSSETQVHIGKATEQAWKVLSQPLSGLPTGDMAVVAKLLMTEVDHWGVDLIDLLRTWLQENEGTLNLGQLNNAARGGIANWFNKYKTDTDQTNVYCVESSRESGFLSDLIEENNYISELDFSELEGIVWIDPVTADFAKSNKNVLNFFPHKHETPEGDIWMFMNKNWINYKNPTQRTNNYLERFGQYNARGRYNTTVVKTSWEDMTTAEQSRFNRKFPGYSQSNLASEQIKHNDLIHAFPLYVLPDYAALGYKKFIRNVAASQTYGQHSWSNQSGFWSINAQTQINSIKLVTNWTKDDQDPTQWMPVMTEIACPGLSLKPGDVCKISSQDVWAHTFTYVGVINAERSAYTKRFDDPGGRSKQALYNNEYYLTERQHYGYVEWTGRYNQGVGQNSYLFSHIRQPINEFEKIKGMGMILQISGDQKVRDTRGRYEYPYYCQIIESHKITVPIDVDDNQKFVFKDWTGYTPFKKRSTGLSGDYNETRDGPFKEVENSTITPMFKDFEGFKYTPQDQYPSRTLTMWQFSDFLLNVKSGSVNSYKYTDLPPAAQWVLDDYKWYLSKNPWLWEIRTRESKTQLWTDKGMRSAKTANRSWTWPNDITTGDPEYLKATISGDGYNLYLTSHDELTKHTLHFGGGRWASSYANPINNDVWGKLPRTGTRRRGGEYISWDLKTLIPKKPFRREWYYDLLTPYVSGNKSTYLSNITFADPLGADLKRLDYCCAALYKRFSPELQATELVKGDWSIAWPTKAAYQTQTQIFDLVGTKYYMAIIQRVNWAKPRISLIVKDKSVITVLNKQKLHLDDTTHKPHIIDAINQTNTLFLDGHTTQLNTKFTFSKHPDKIVNFDLTLNSFDLPAEGLTEYYNYIFKGPIEWIDNQYSISKKRVANTLDVVEYERLRLDREMYADQRVINQAQITEIQRANTTSINAAYQDYSLQKWETNKAVITGGVFGGAGAAAGGVAVGGAMSAMAAGSVAGPIGAAIGAVVGAASAITGAVEASQKAATESMKTSRDLLERETAAAKNVQHQKNQLDLTHKHAEIQMRRELDRASNQYINPIMSDKSVLDAYLETSGKYKYHIIHNFASPAMMLYLNAFFNEYGADVLAPDFTLHPPFIKNTNQILIYQFTSVHSTEIKDIPLLRHLQERLKNGIKII